MRNFARAFRLAFRYRWTFAASVLAALGVGVLWGANIGAIYPFVEVAFQGESMHKWVARRIDEAEREAESQAEIVRGLQRRLSTASADERAAIEAKISLAESRREAEQRAAGRHRAVQPYIERFLPDDPFDTVIVIVGVLLVGTVLKDLLLIGHTVLVARLAELTTFNLRKQFYRRTLRMDLATFSAEGTSDLMARFTNDMQGLSAGLTTLLGKLVREPIKAVACLAGAAWICWRLLLFSFVFVPLAVVSIGWLAKALKRANRRAMEEMAQLYNTLDETFRGIKLVKAFTMERHERRRFHHGSKQFYNKSMRIARYDALTRPLTELTGIAIISLALLAGAYLVLKGETHLLGIRMCPRPLSLGALLVFYGLLAGVADPARKLADVFTRLQRGAAAADRIYQRLDREPAVCDPPKPVRLGRHHIDLTFDRVSFAYHPGRPVVEEIDLRIGFGETIAIVGPNGCGKSTLLSLVARFADPCAGEIRLDALPLPAVRMRDLRNQIGLVTQETLLFDDTVANNIRYGSPRATDEQVVSAAQRALAHRFIEEQLPAGYQTVVGPQGCRLSGGQRQRIALARAMLRDPAILLFDEITSQVDPESEQAIQRALERFVRERTTLLVTHRMGMLALADRIVVMESGRIVDTGTHAELVARCALYQRLRQMQLDGRRASA